MRFQTKLANGGIIRDNNLFIPTIAEKSLIDILNKKYILMVKK